MATFNFTFDPGTTLQQMIGFEIAGRVWGKYLTDNTTINLQVGVSSSLGSNVIGGALPAMRTSQNYLDYRKALNNGPKSTDDTTAINSLPNATTYTTSFAFINDYTLNYKTESRSTVNMTRAVAKAAGITLTDGTTALDGYVLFSNLANTTANGQPVRWSYDFTRSGTQAANTLDFLSTAIHEIGHVLGFVSGIDQPGLYGMETDWNSTPDPSSTQAYMTGMSNRLQYTNPLDLFRYSQAGLRNMSYGQEFGIQKYLSLDGGNTSIAQFSGGLDTYNEGDGYQASHWKNGTTAIMNPTLSLSQRRSISALDLRAMDVIGWDIASTGSNTAIDLSALLLQSGVALATRAGQALNATTWINNNLTASPTQLGTNRDSLIYTMLKNSGVYDLTRIAAPGATGWTSRLSLEQVFQQRSLFSTVDELDTAPVLPTIEVVGERVGDSGFTNTDSATPQLRQPAIAIAPLAKIIQFYRETLSASVPPSPTPLQKITIEVLAQTVIASQKSAERFGSDLTFSTRAYDSGLPRSTRFSTPTVSTESNHFPAVLDESLFANFIAI